MNPLCLQSLAAISAVRVTHSWFGVTRSPTVLHLAHWIAAWPILSPSHLLVEGVPQRWSFSHKQFDDQLVCQLHPPCLWSPGGPALTHLHRNMVHIPPSQNYQINPLQWEVQRWKSPNVPGWQHQISCISWWSQLGISQAFLSIGFHQFVCSCTYQITLCCLSHTGSQIVQADFNTLLLSNSEVEIKWCMWLLTRPFSSWFPNCSGWTTLLLSNDEMKTERYNAKPHHWDLSSCISSQCAQDWEAQKRVRLHWLMLWHGFAASFHRLLCLFFMTLPNQSHYHLGLTLAATLSGFPQLHAATLTTTIDGSPLSKLLLLSCGQLCILRPIVWWLAPIECSGV
jgi:hypothetical protein